MRRLSPLLLILCLLLGALTTLAVAWSCAAFMNPGLAEAKFDHTPRADGGSDVLVIQRRFGHSRINRAQCSQLLLDQNGEILMARWQSGGEENSESRAGWPLRAFFCENPGQVSIITGAKSAMQVTRGGGGFTVEGGWELPGFSGGRLGTCWRAIPLRPIWGGLLADVAILSAAWFALLAGVAAIKRRRRLERGRCSKCGYDLRSSGLAHERCPECGAAVLARQP